MLFTCLDVLITSQQKAFMDHDYAWITQWEIEHVPRYGQYQVGPRSRPVLTLPFRLCACSLCEVCKDLPLSRLLSSAELQRVPAGVPRRQRLLGRPRGVRGAWPLACRPLRAAQHSWQLVVAACRGRVPVSGRSFIVSCSSTVSADD